jgi:FkbM family methyltransferase
VLNIKFTKQLVDSRYLTLEFEEFLSMHYSKMISRGDTVIDIGANQGFHTSKFLSLVGTSGRVIALEPIPEMYNVLSKIKNKNLTLLQKAAGKENKKSSFVKAVHKTGSMAESGLKKREFNDEAGTNVESITVDVITVDSLTIPEKVNFIKIDIEGGEIDALNGARKLIDRDRPYISVEYGDKSYLAYGNTDETLWNLTEELSYSIFDIFLNKISSLEEWKKVVNSFYWDYLLIPKERLDEFNRYMLE